MNQVIDMSHQEKVDMYMMLPKEKLVEMLIKCNRVLVARTPEVYVPKPTDFIVRGHVLSGKLTVTGPKL